MIRPADITAKSFKKISLGYAPEEVDQFLDQIMTDYETLYTENVEMKDKLSMLAESVNYYRTIEKSLQSTLMLAEKTAEETKEAAVVAGAQIEKEAKLHADEILREAKNQRFMLEQEIDKLKSQYELMRTRVKLLLYAEIELIDKNDIFADKEKEKELDLAKMEIAKRES